MACPVCGGQIHPIAGRCKHCKTDLAALRGAAMPASPVALPQLAQPAIQPEVWTTRPQGTNGYSNGYAGGHANGATMPTVLPPMAAVVSPGQIPRGSSWSRRWPIVVVVLAAIAIVVSIVLLLKNDRDPPKSSRINRGALNPSIDNNMNTNPMPDPGSADPWGKAPTLPDNPVPVPPPPPDDDTDIFPQGGVQGGVPGGGAQIDPGGGGTIPAPPREEFFSAMGSTACARMTTCGGTGASTLCDQLTEMYKDFTAASCTSYDRAKASRCLTQLNKLPCIGSGASWDLNQFSSMLYGLSDCTDACTH